MAEDKKDQIIIKKSQNGKAVHIYPRNGKRNTTSVYWIRRFLSGNLKYLYVPRSYSQKIKKTV